MTIMVGTISMNRVMEMTSVKGICMGSLKVIHPGMLRRTVCKGSEVDLVNR